MKIVFAGVFKDTSTNPSQANALERCGFEVIRFEIEQGDYADRLVRVCYEESPQLLLLSKCADLLPSVIPDIQSLGVRCHLWFMDPLFTFNKIPHMADMVKACDHSFFNIRETYDNALRLSPNCSFLQEGYDADVDHPHSIPKEVDVAFIGHLRGSREKYFEEVGFKVFKDTYGERHAETVSATKINLNFTDGGASDRVYKVMAAGGFLLTQPWPKMEKDFKIGTHLDVFNSISELKEKIDYYLKNDVLREEIAENGHKEVQRFSRDAWARVITHVPEKKGMRLFSRVEPYAGVHDIDFEIGPMDRVVDVGGGHKPFSKATHIIDMADTEEQRHGMGLKIGGREFLEGDVCEVLRDLPDNYFDFCWSSHTFEHIENLPEALELISAKCKRGFYALPASDFEFMTAKSHFGHVNMCRLIGDVLHICKRPPDTIIDRMAEMFEKKLFNDMEFNRLWETDFRFIWEARCYWEDRIKYRFHDNPLFLFPQLGYFL